MSKGKSVLLSQLADRLENTQSNDGPFAPSKSSRCELIVEEDRDIYDADSTIERIVVKNGVSNHPDIYEWDLSECERLVELVVGNDCLQYLEEWKLSGLKSMEKVEFGGGCMCKSEGGVFEMSECEKLKSVVIGGGCFVNWSSFTLKNCGVVEVSIGDGCFVSCENTVFESKR